jgi:Fe-S-cluster containining protein
VIDAFTCDLCGACCRTFSIFASAADAQREPRIREEGRPVPEHLADQRWTYRLYPLPFHEACCFLDGENRCTIYETRPDVCRGFEVGGPQCQEARKARGLGSLQRSDK